MMMKGAMIGKQRTPSTMKFIVRMMLKLFSVELREDHRAILFQRSQSLVLQMKEK